MSSITTQIKELDPMLDEMISIYVKDLSKPYVNKTILLQSFKNQLISQVVSELERSSFIKDIESYKDKPKNVSINRDKTSGFIVNRGGISTIYRKGHNGVPQKMSEVFRAFINDEDMLFGLDKKSGREFFKKHMGNHDDTGKYRPLNTFPKSSGTNKESEVRELKNVGGFYSTSNSTKDKMKYIISMCEDKGYGLEIIYNE